MKFGEFFKNYALATLIYTLISGVLDIGLPILRHSITSVRSKMKK